MSGKNRRPGRPPSQRRGPGPHPSAARGPDPEPILRDLESRGLIRSHVHAGETVWEPRIGAAQYVRLVLELTEGDRDHRYVVRKEHDPDAPLEIFGADPKFYRDVVGLLVDHARRYPGGAGSHLGPVPYHSEPANVEIRTIPAGDELASLMAEAIRAGSIGVATDPADVDQNLMELESAGFLRAWRDGDGPAACYQIRVVEGVWEEWPRR